MSKVSIRSELLDLETLIERINQRDYLVIAADEKVLSQLPSGNWIAGTIPYFMGEDGGEVSQNKAFVNTIEGVSGNNPPRITPYDVHSIENIASDAPDNGFTITILPAGSDIHINYADNAPSFPNMFFTPVVGWIAGSHLAEADATAKVGFGTASMLMEDKGIAMHVPLPENQFANINIVNLFQQGSGAEIKFPQSGFNVNNCEVDGQPTNLASYLKEHNIDTRLPLVADYNGVNVNVSIKEAGSDSVDLYAPVFEGVSYRFANPVGDYVASLESAIATEQTDQAALSFNCILNFLYGELESRKTSTLTGPFTFGEIAYQLVNQTLVYLTLEEA
ncbi:DUF6976 family protein [Bacterioplanoides sp.]|uniref:DUF6976 family protein n=1 Tax=Bacterioplanoides sp. TaxID=2066072 RepID=UPI003B5911A9